MENTLILSGVSKRFISTIDKIGISAYKLEKISNKVISQSKITHIKSGRNEPSNEIINKLIELFPDKVDKGYILLGTPPLSSEAKQIEDFNFLNIPFVPIHAQAGYTRGYGDFEYVESLPTIPVIVDKNYRGKYRVFEVEGDSMDDGTRNAICHGDKILGREVKQEYWNTDLHIKDWYFVIVMKNDGILVKKIIYHDVDNHKITYQSLNPDKSSYPDDVIDLAEVAELYNVIKIVDRNTRI